jgi:nitrate/nitrite transport system permease protein
MMDVQNLATHLPRRASSRRRVARWVIEAGHSALLTTMGFGLLLLLWMALSAAVGKDLPGPAATLQVFWKLIANPFYDNGPNDKGIALQIAGSLGRVFSGFLLGAGVGITGGILLGALPVCRRIADPVIQILRPVSPLAWFPIGLATFKSAPTAVVFAIFITSLWPTLINTAFGVASLPNDYRNVARVFQFSRGKYVTRVLLPFALPHILTGLRLSMGVAWMVIVAGEMLAGGTGIGFFVWDSWNALSLERVMSAILLIGLVGLCMDRGFEWLMRRVAYVS